VQTRGFDGRRRKIDREQDDDRWTVARPLEHITMHLVQVGAIEYLTSDGSALCPAAYASGLTYDGGRLLNSTGRWIAYLFSRYGYRYVFVYIATSWLRGGRDRRVDFAHPRPVVRMSEESIWEFTFPIIPRHNQRR
jgi:hypothetical protein